MDNAAETKEPETAIFAAGCFWGVEDAFRQIDGVLDVESGYTGGHVDNPSYEAVCRTNTGHAEAVRVRFDPELVGYDDLLGIFFSLHDPTTRDRQGPDFGSQYRSAVFYASPEQQELAAQAKAKAQLEWSRPVVTEVEPAADFYRAEEYHQRYFEKTGMAGCHVPSRPH